MAPPGLRRFGAVKLCLKALWSYLEEGDFLKILVMV